MLRLLLFFVLAVSADLCHVSTEILDAQLSERSVFDDLLESFVYSFNESLCIISHPYRDAGLIRISLINDLYVSVRMCSHVIVIGYSCIDGCIYPSLKQEIHGLVQSIDVLNCCAIAYAGKASLPLLELDDFAEELLLFAEELDFALLLEDFAEELEATLEDDSLELDATELLEGNFSNWATRLTVSVAVK